MPADLDALCRICGGISPAERQAITRVADEFFPVNGDGSRHNGRADQELNGYATQADTNRRIAAEREAKRKEREALNGSLNDSLPVGSTNDQPKLEVRSQKLEVTKPEKSKTLGSSDKTLSPEEVEIFLTLNDKTEYPVSKALVAEWGQLYPAVDVPQTLREIKGWFIANPSKRKTRSGILRCINTWLSKEQNKG